MHNGLKIFCISALRIGQAISKSVKQTEKTIWEVVCYQQICKTDRKDYLGGCLLLLCIALLCSAEISGTTSQTTCFHRQVRW